MLKNKDISLLIKVEHLIGDNLEELLGRNGEWDGRKGLSDLYKDDPTWTFDRDDFDDFYNLIEREIEEKRKVSARVSEYHRRNPEKHRRYNREYARKKRLLNNNKKGEYNGL